MNEYVYTCFFFFYVLTSHVFGNTHTHVCHHKKVWNQDDTVAVKDGSEDMLFERVTASGIGLTIGSIGTSTVRNITFRDCNMYDTYKVRPCVGVKPCLP